MAGKGQIELLLEHARQAREIAKLISNEEAAAGLIQHAEEYEAQAAQLDDDAIPTLPAAAAIPSGEPPIAHAAAALKPGCAGT